MIIERQLDTVTKVRWDSATGMMKIIPFSGPEIWLAPEAQVLLIDLVEEIVMRDLPIGKKT